jgi:hypothetical protein
MSDEPKLRRGHPIRLAMFMLIGAAIGALLSTPIQGHGQHVANALMREMAYIVCGSLTGAGSELFVRFKRG